MSTDETPAWLTRLEAERRHLTPPSQNRPILTPPSTGTTAPRPPFGLQHVIPDTAMAAWGMRGILRRGEPLDVLMDRMGSDEGPHSPTLLDLLNERFGMREMRSVIDDLVGTSWMRGDTAEDFVIYQDEQMTVLANTNASHGYCYVTAWLW